MACGARGTTPLVAMLVLVAFSGPIRADELQPEQLRSFVQEAIRYRASQITSILCWGVVESYLNPAIPGSNSSAPLRRLERLFLWGQQPYGWREDALQVVPVTSASSSTSAFDGRQKYLLTNGNGEVGAHVVLRDHVGHWLDLGTFGSGRVPADRLLHDSTAVTGRDRLGAVETHRFEETRTRDDSVGPDCWWVDLERGCSVVGYQLRLRAALPGGAGEKRAVWVVDQLKELMPDVWVPVVKRCIVSSVAPDGRETWLRVERFTVTGLRVNLAASELPFQLVFPLGTEVGRVGQSLAQVGGDLTPYLAALKLDPLPQSLLAPEPQAVPAGWLPATGDILDYTSARG